MLRVLFDENFNGRIIAGIQRILPQAELLTVWEAGHGALPDPPLLDWAAQEKRLLITSDVQTMVGFAYERLMRGDYTPGVLVVPQSMPIGQAIS